MKKFFSGGLAVILILIIIATLIPFVFSTDTIKKAVIAKVETATGRNLKIDGALHFQLIPEVGVVANKVALSSLANSETSESFLSADSLKINVALLPLLQRTIVIKSFALENPTLTLHVFKNGMKNWQGPVTQLPATHAHDTTPSNGASSLSALPANINLSNVAMRNGTVTYTDDVAGTKTIINKIYAKLSLDKFASPLKLDGSAEWAGKTVALQVEVSTLQSIFNHTPTSIKASLKTDFLVASVEGSYNAGGFDGKSHIVSRSLKELKSWLQPTAKPLETPAPLALDVSGDIHCKNENCDIRDVTASLDALSAKGTVAYTFENATPSLTLQLTTGVLDINPFLTPERHADSGVGIEDALAEPAATHWSAASINFSALKAITLVAHVNAGGIKYRNITLGKSVVDTKLKAGKLAAIITSPECYSGKYTLAVDLDTGVNPVGLQVHGAFNEIELAPLLKDAADIDKLSGKATIGLDVTSHGGSEQAIISNLSGNGNIMLTNGTITGINILDLVHHVQSALAKDDNPSQVTKFSKLAGTFTINNGVINNQDLALAMSGLTASGKGTVDLPAYTINYRLTAQLAGKTSDGKAAAGVGIPVLIIGSLDHPNIKPDVGAAIQNTITNPGQLKEQLKAGGLTSKNFKGLVKGLQGN